MTITCENYSTNDYYIAVESFERFLQKRFEASNVIAWSRPEQPILMYGYYDRYLTLILQKSAVLQEVLFEEDGLRTGIIMQNRYQLVHDRNEQMLSSHFTWGSSTALNVMYSVQDKDGSTHFYIYKR